jgi:parallel beta-helix repeat protein
MGNRLFENGRSGIVIVFSSNFNVFTDNFIFDNGWNGILLYASIGNTLTSNTVYNNGDGIILQNANENVIENNILDNNFGEGIGIHGSSNNIISGNQIGFSGLKGIMIDYDYGSETGSEFNTIESNDVFGGAEDGISVEWSYHNYIAHNNLFGNNWAGIRIYGTSSENTIFENFIYNNWGGGVAFESYSAVFMRYWWNITATEADHISWQASILDPDESVVKDYYELLEVVLTVDGELVGVWFSDIYFDDGRQEWRFDIDSYLDPLPIGEHEFHTEFFYDGVLQDEWTWTAFVTVEPATDENYVTHNDISENDIFENGWAGIILSRSHYNTITNNQIHNNWGSGIDISSSVNNIVEINNIYWNDAGININSANQNHIANNDIFENNGGGIQLSGTSSENSLVDNNIHHNWWGAGIQLETWSEVHLRFGQDITATEADSISWHDSFRDPDEWTVKFWYENLEVL